MNADQAKALRAPFPPEQIGKLPRGGIELDYVGHAATTDRLLQVDPEWTWEPAAYDDEGAPLIAHGGLWIKLTVAGVTRYGFGDGPTVKEMIGDAIRNAAMRFGVALDLWAKEPLGEAQEAGDREGAPAAASHDASAASPAADQPIENRQHRLIGAIIGRLGELDHGAGDWTGHSREWIKDRYGKRSRKQLTKDEGDALIAHLLELEEQEKRRAEAVAAGEPEEDFPF